MGSSFRQQRQPYISLGEVNEILQVDVIAVSLDIVVNEEVELVFDPILKEPSGTKARPRHASI